MSDITDAFLGYSLLICIGVALICAYRFIGPQVYEEYRQQFFENPAKRMGWDVFWMILTRGGCAPVTFVMWLPILGFILIIVGLGKLVGILF